MLSFAKKTFQEKEIFEKFPNLREGVEEMISIENDSKKALNVLSKCRICSELLDISEEEDSTVKSESKPSPINDIEIDDEIFDNSIATSTNDNIAENTGNLYNRR